MTRNCSSEEIKLEKFEQIERGKRIANIRENELHMTKTQLAKAIGISPQFLGLVESGKANLVYSHLRKLRDLSCHSSDYILFGIDDYVLKQTQTFLEDFSEPQIIAAFDIIKDLSLFIKNS